MVDNNIWLTSTLPDFTIDTVSDITFQAGSSGTATITLTVENGFSSSISLSVDTASGLTCTLDQYTIQGSGTATLTCNGQPGTYTVTITAGGGYATHSAQIAVTVTSAPDFAINPISSITFQTGSSGTAAITFAGQGGFGIQTAPAAAKLAAALLLGLPPDEAVAGLDPAPYAPGRFQSIWRLA